MFAKNDELKISDDVIAKVNNSSTEVVSLQLFEATCYWATGTVSCNGSSSSIWTSIYSNSIDALAALNNNANNVCGGSYYDVSCIDAIATNCNII